MNSLNWSLGISHILTGAVLMLVSWPLVQGRVKPNRWYGVRIPQAFESDAHWYAINRYGGRVLMLWSALLIVLGVLCFVLPSDKDSLLVPLLALAPCLLILVPLFLIFRFAKTL